mmetsp:Transcript_74662/g.112489  ORF Transcript_74662/g.112489 Transcript_74662/m.112489 type:complete len:101 (-) Transcript_74662:28-330(-)
MSAIFQSLSRTLLRPAVTNLAGVSPYFQLSALRFKQSVKTNSGVKKRIRLRGSGSLKRTRAGTSHNTGFKDRQRVNRLGNSTGVEGKKIEQRIRKMLGCY